MQTIFLLDSKEHVSTFNIAINEIDVWLLKHEKCRKYIFQVAWRKHLNIHVCINNHTKQFKVQVMCLKSETESTTFLKFLAWSQNPTMQKNGNFR